MGWRIPAGGFNSANPSAPTGNGSTSAIPPVSTSTALSPSDADTEALTAQVFSKNAAQLMQHPAFHQLDQARQQEAITAQVFSKNAAQLMQHPAFHQLDQAR